MGTGRTIRYRERVRELGCALCQIIGYGKTPPEVHHVFETSARSDWLIVPLCGEHHRGGTGFHGLGERAFNARYKTSEKDLLAWTIQNLNQH